MRNILPFVFLLFTFYLLLSTNTYARVTPEDIVNAKRESYNLKIVKYSDVNRQKLESFSQKIADLNKKITDDWQYNCLRQGQILDEYVKRKKIIETGAQRDSSDPVSNARYYLTYAHEAVVYQAAKIYIFDLTYPSNINRDISTKISELESDTTILKAKVAKSQRLIKELVSRD